MQFLFNWFGKRIKKELKVKQILLLEVNNKIKIHKKLGKMQ